MKLFRRFVSGPRVLPRARRKRAGALAVLVAAVSMVAAGGTAAAALRQGPHKSASAKTASFALPLPGAANYILPLESGAYADPQNVQWFQYLMYRPLYMIGSGNSVTLDKSLSLAKPPVYTNHDRTVTIKLKSYRWSDGKPVTARDVEFWENLVKANKTGWFSYVPGFYPDNVTSMKVLGQRTIQFHLDKAYLPQWFTDNELSQITPLPQHTMDRTSAGSRVGNYDRTKAGAVAVLKYLDGQARNEGGYTTNPLWKVIDGPWKLSSFDPTTGHAVFRFNKSYSGPVAKNHITTFVEDTFTSDVAEYNVLRSNGLDYGYIPLQDAAQSSQLSAYRSAPWGDVIAAYFIMNQNNPKVGAIFRQTYFRQVVEELIDQKGMINAFYGGYGTINCGPIPFKPKNPWVSPYEKTCPYSYNPHKAVKTLKAHGWTVKPGGVSYCTVPSKCGPGIHKGEKLSFQYLYAVGKTAFDNALQVVQSDAEKAGIKYQLKGATFGAVLGAIAPCGPGSVAPKANCSTEIANWGAGWGYQPDFYPSGELLFASGAGANYENYSNQKADKLIHASLLSGHGNEALFAYENYMTDQVPVVWQPYPLRQLSEIRKGLKGMGPQSVEGDIFPEKWHFVR